MKSIDNTRRSRPILFATLGYPGSGKTYFSRKFAKESHILHLNSDRIRKAMFGKPKYNQYENNYLFAVMDAFIEESLATGISVIYDANSTLKEYRKHLRGIARKYGASFFLLWFQTPVTISKRRLGIRKRCKTKICALYHPPFPLEEFEVLRAKIEEPPKSEPHVVINGADTYAKQKKMLLGVLSKNKLLIS